MWIVIIISLLVSVTTFYTYHRRSGKLQKLQNETAAIADQKKSLIADIENLQAGKSDLETKLEKLKAITERIQVQVNKLGEEINDLSQRKSDLERENAHLSREVSKKNFLRETSR